MNRSVYSFLLKTYGQRPKWWLGFGIAAMQMVLMRVIAVILIARLAADIASGNFEQARTSVVLYLVVAGIGLGCRLAKELISLRAENAEYGSMMIRYYQKLVAKDMMFFRDHQTGYLASTFRQHVDNTLLLVRLIRSDVLQTFISLLAPTVVLFVASWKVGLVAVIVVIVQIVYVLWSSAVANEHRMRSQQIYRKISGAVSDDITNIVAYRTSGLSGAALARLEKLTGEEIDTFWQRRKIVAVLNTPRELITVFGTACAFWVIIGNAETIGQSVGLVVLTTMYMFQIFQIVSSLPDIISQHDELITKIYPTLEYLSDEYEKIKDPINPRSFAKVEGRIDIEGVDFAYGDARERGSRVFAGLDLHIKPGEQVGVVGLSGAGKSTLANLLLRFDEVNSGSIKIDGIDIREVLQADLRQQIAYVPQEPLLFHRSVRENLQYFSSRSSDAKMVRAAKAAHAHEFISKLPDGYDTLVGERGIKLSGGQKQRVVIARAILKDSPIMLFDEATSALDSESEKIIQKAMPGIIGKRTAIVIAHRLSTVAGLDRIIVMHEGKVAEEGTHKRLLRHKGLYYSLWQKQTSQRSN